jgi:hypothetical protein
LIAFSLHFFSPRKSAHLILQARRITAAHRERLSRAAEVDFIRVVERLLQALDEFDVDDRGAMDTGEMLFGQSLFPSLPGQVAQVGQNLPGQVDAPVTEGFKFFPFEIDRKEVDIAIGLQITDEPADIFALA